MRKTMDTRKELGKIQSAYYGLGGYQEVELGISFTLGGDSWGIGDFWGMWADKPTEYASWTREEQITQHGMTADRIAKLLAEAKVNRVEQLVGIPIEITFKGSRFESWRVLTEVL
jgi:hypothetical protein